MPSHEEGGAVSATKTSSSSKVSKRQPLNSNDALSEWELPISPNQTKTFNFESPLRGDFTDLSSPHPYHDGQTESEGFGHQSPRGIAETTLEISSDFNSSKSMSARTKAGEIMDSKRDVQEYERVDLGLDKVSMGILARGVPAGSNIVEEYMKAKEMSDEQWAREKHGMAPIPPLGSWEAEEKAARRVAEILTMPIYGPNPHYKGRNPRLFTHSEEKYFDKYPRTAKNYNKFIWSLAKLGEYEKAKNAIERMKEHGVERDVGIYTSLMQGCIIKKDPREAMRVFVDMRRDGIKPDLWVFDALMETFVESGELEGAFALYDELKPNGLEPTTIIFTTLVKGCLKDGDIERAWKVFDHMRIWHCEPDEILMNLMIYACAKKSEAERAHNLYTQMKSMGLRPTHSTFNALLYAYARRKDYYAQAWDLLKTMKVEGYIPDHRTFDMLLAVAAKGGDVSTAELCFDEAMSVPNAPKREHPYAFMIEAYAMAHRVHAEQHNLKKYVSKAEALFDRMIKDGIVPTHRSANLMLNVYTYNSMISKAVEWKKKMKQVYNLAPDVYTYTSMIEMYGRTRQMDLALDQFNLMKAEKLKPSLTTYGVLIEGCTRSHLITTGMKLLKEMKANDIDITPELTFVINFRRGLVKMPDLIREIDQLTGKAYRFVMPWRRKGSIKKLTYKRELTKEEAKRTSLYG